VDEASFILTLKRDLAGEVNYGVFCGCDIICGSLPVTPIFEKSKKQVFGKHKENYL
jgi:hypothetical protein